MFYMFCMIFETHFMPDCQDPFNSYTRDAIKVTMEGTPWPLCRFSGWSKQGWNNDMTWHVQGEQKDLRFQFQFSSNLSCKLHLFCLKTSLKLFLRTATDFPEISIEQSGLKSIWRGASRRCRSANNYASIDLATKLKWRGCWNVAKEDMEENLIKSTCNR